MTDAAFRAMFVKYSKTQKTKGAPELVLFTEFVSCDGLVSDEGRLKLLRELYYTEEERPIVAQIFGSQPENVEKTAQLIKELGFDGLDLNMGCPDKTIEKQKSGAALIKDPVLAQEIIVAAKQGAGDLPVSVKTRLGYNEIDFSWLEKIIDKKPAALTVHLRTRKEMSLSPAHWEIFPEIVSRIQKEEIIIIGNGDVIDIKDGLEKAKYFGADGIMIGRGAFGNPWLLINNHKRKLSLEDRLRVMLEHTELFWNLYGPTKTNKKLFYGHQKNFAVMKKHFKAYVRGFVGASFLREQLMGAKNPEEIKKILLKQKLIT
ncbi:MAG: tRNA-dihydrouridine synthase [Candidatus Paceibacterota bacterium]|jgi:tRNA-dihydrouridine synthase